MHKCNPYASCYYTFILCVNYIMSQVGRLKTHTILYPFGAHGMSLVLEAYSALWDNDDLVAGTFTDSQVCQTILHTHTRYYIYSLLVISVHACMPSCINDCIDSMIAMT